ncbi:MAG: alpha-amylase family glycosyl hydrolase [Pseudomonadota bacterium]
MGSDGVKTLLVTGIFTMIAGLGVASASAQPAMPHNFRDRLPTDEIVYFILPDRFENGDTDNDRGGIEGGRLDHGFDPTHKGFFHGGDLKGLTQRLDYIESLGATAIWLGPIYKNNPVQGAPGQESAGYHGYWITDFTRVDPHFGSNADLKNFVDAAHGRGIKIYLDIITNHTADIIAYRECHDPAYGGDDKVVGECVYRPKADYPYTTRGLRDADPINDEFMGDQPPFQTADNFAGLARHDYAYTPYVPAGNENVKVPASLNDPRYYHNRGNSHWTGESVTYGDFAGLDDLMTEDPRVLQGFIDIFKGWITEFGIDGFRIDTAKHVNPEFWRVFNKAMQDHARAQGIPNFYIFGEVYDPNPAGLARHTRDNGFPTVLDFAFQNAARDVIVNGAPTKVLATLFAVDGLYAGGRRAARDLPVFTGNHDMGRFAMFVRQGTDGLPEDEVERRTILAHAMMFFLRGVPVIYYGDEQGFNGDGNDQASREDMFASQVDSYNDNILVGTRARISADNFNLKHPLFKAFQTMARLHKAEPLLRHGHQTIRLAEEENSAFVVSRVPDDGADRDFKEILVAFNFGPEERAINVTVDPRSTQWKSLHGKCRPKVAARGSYALTLPPTGYVVCKSK